MTKEDSALLFSLFGFFDIADAVDGCRWQVEQFSVLRDNPSNPLIEQHLFFHNI